MYFDDTYNLALQDKASDNAVNGSSNTNTPVPNSLARQRRKRVSLTMQMLKLLNMPLVSGQYCFVYSFLFFFKLFLILYVLMHVCYI